MATEAITFVVPGQEQPVEAGATRGGAAAAPLPAGLSQGRVKQSVRVGAQRGGGGDVRLTAVPGEDVVVLHIANGPELVLHPETARDLMLAQGEVKRSRGAQGAEEPGPDEVKVPVQLQWRGLEEGVAVRGATRGFLGDVLLSAVDVITGLFKDPAADFAASKVVDLVDGQVADGVYALKADTLSKLKETGTPLAQVPAAPDGGPLLVFVHGTFSTTHGTFGKLWTQHPERVRSLFNRYDNRVYALDHPTLGASPIANALTLVKALPQGARLHLVTHSRGGLVAEVLARVCADTDLDRMDLFDDEHAAQRGELKQLADLVQAKGVRVERIVRVACPARGTLLASKRLDAYVSVLKWTLELASIPVAPVLIDFLGEVARRRADPELLPGLAAQIPDSPLVQWLHAVDKELPGELRVVAGDMEGDSVASWLKTLLADAFYWTDNDLVVQTRSMYGGAPRARDARFLLHQGGKVSHFSYFSNERTAEAIVNAITQDRPQGFRIIGPLSWAGESSTGSRGAGHSADDGRPSSEKPAVFVLPGILGSNLKVDGERIWLGPRLINGLKRLDYRGQPDGVEPDGPIGLIYDDLSEFLAKTHEVKDFAFDWRRPMEEEARRLAIEVEAALVDREKSGQPVRLLAHSMGGLVARTMQLERPKVWDRMMAHPGARLLMLGTPNGGSWAPMQVLSGDDTFGNTIVTFGAPFQDHKARELLARFPGFLQLQAALLDAPLGLARSATWQELAAQDLERIRERSWWHRNWRDPLKDLQLDVYRWGVPPQDVLDRAVSLRKRLDEQRDKSLGNFKDKLLLVVGRARFTPIGYEIGPEGLVYLDAPEEGDGRVTQQSALLPGVRTWSLDCEHGSLPSKKEAFEAFRELLEKGNTSLLARLPDASATRGAGMSGPALVPSRPSRTRPVTRPPESARELLALESRQLPGVSATPGMALHVTVINGDLSFVRQPLLLGHYRSLRLTGTESVMDGLIGHTMNESLKIGLYPDAPGTHQVFVNTHADPEDPRQMPRPEAVIVVGLGEEGKLKASHLIHTVRQAVIAWAQRMVERAPGVPAHFELASTLIGSGGTGITPVQAAQLIAQGVREANERLETNRWPRVSHLYLIELYLDRASEAWRALQVQATATPGRYQVTQTVQPGTGALPRPLTSGYRGADYDFISAVTPEGPSGADSIIYTLDTRRARSEVRAQRMQTKLLREMVTRDDDDRNDDPLIGLKLFRLLVPVEMEAFFGGTTEMVIEVDRGTAGIPWELLDSGTGDPRPWAVRTKLLRKLRTEGFRAQTIDAQADAFVLVVGEPQCDPKYRRLPGARREASAVAGYLKAPDVLGDARVRALVSEDPQKVGYDARAIIGTLLEREWRIIHIAGHGEPPEGDDPRGVVLSHGIFLGAREIRSMRVVPELVFVNCCYLAQRDPGQLLQASEEIRLDRARFAAGVAEELINLGVRCVVAAGWEVEDGPAETFARRFYESILRGESFIEAVAQARLAAYDQGGNTWAAYQCYGDPDWSFKREGADAQRPPKPLADEFAGVASPVALVLALKTLAVESKYQKADLEKQRTKIRHLEARFAAQWGNLGEVAEAFGLACAEIKDTTRAIEWYERALAANDGSASIKAAEQLGNLRARLAWKEVEARSKGGALVPSTVLDEAREKIKKALTGLQRIVAVQPTVERESMCGSAYKLLALVEEVAGDQDAEIRAVTRMKQHYQRAEGLARANQDPDLFYPALNRMAAELILKAGTPNWRGFDPAEVAEMRQSLAVRTRDNPDFWSVAGVTDLRLYEALANSRLAGQLGSIKSGYGDLHSRVSAPWMWDSVYKQARFVLPKYKKRALPTEQQAADELQGWLETLAKS